MRATLSWLTHHGPVEHAVRLFSLSWRFWWLRGHATEFARVGEEIVANSEHLPPYQRALALTTTGFMLVANEDHARAQTLFEQSLPLYRRASGKLRLVLTAAVQGILGLLAARCGDYSRASELLGQSQAVLAELDDDELTGYARYEYLLFLCMVNNILGHVRLSQGDLDGAAQLFSTALAAGREGQDRLGFLVSLYNLAASSRAQGDLAAAAGHLNEGLAVAAEAGDETSAAYYLEGMAAVASLQDNPERAVRLLTAAGDHAGKQWQRLAARLHTARPARRCRPGRAALPYRGRGIRQGPGVGPVHRARARRGVRAGVTGVTRRSALVWPTVRRAGRRPARCRCDRWSPRPPPR